MINVNYQTTKDHSVVHMYNKSKFIKLREVIK